MSLCVCLVYNITGLGFETGASRQALKTARLGFVRRCFGLEFLTMYNIYVGSNKRHDVALRRCLEQQPDTGIS